MPSSRRRGLAWLALATALHLASAARATPKDRSQAFIGYQEVANEGCTDLLDDCEDRAGSNQCLSEPYEMRVQCPISCSVAHCSRDGEGAVSVCCWVLCVCACVRKEAAVRARAGQQAREARAVGSTPPPPSSAPTHHTHTQHTPPSHAPHHQQARHAFRGAASPDGTWAYGKLFRAGLAPNHYREVYYHAGRNGALCCAVCCAVLRAVLCCAVLCCAAR